MKKLVIAILGICYSLTIYAQQPELVSDYNVGPENGVRSTEVAFINGKMVIIVMDDEHGKELGVVSNGELTLLKDFYEGAEDGDPRFLTEYNGLIYFSAEDIDNGTAIWTTDGTAQGTVMAHNPGDDNDRPSYFTIAENGWMYYDYNGSIYRTDGTVYQEVYEGGSFYYEYTNASYNFCTYKDGIAFLRKNNDYSFSLIYIAEDEGVELAKTIETGFFGEAFGIASVKNGLMFSLYESDEDGIYVYDETDFSLTRIQVEGEFGLSRRIIDLNDEENISWVGGQGYYSINGVEGEEVQLFESSNNSAVQGDDIIQGVYNGSAAFVASEGFFGDEFLLITDGTTSGTTNLRQMQPYQSDIVLYNNYGFIADGISNNFQPVIYQFNMETNEIFELYSYNNNSIEISSVRPIGGIGGYLYFIYNLDPDVGSELYRISVDVGTTDIKNLEPDGLDFSVKQNGNFIMVEMEKVDAVDVSIYNLKGQKVFYDTVISNQEFMVELISGTYFIRVLYDDKELTKSISIIE